MEHHILFDIPGGGTPPDASFLEQLGHRVMVCEGPARGATCPILTGEGCELAENADGIVFELDLDRPQHRAILANYKKNLRSDIPIKVVVRAEQIEANRELLRGLSVLTHPPVAGDLDALAAEVESSAE
jgi:hypothetical protein